MANQINRPSRDNNADGLVDGSKRYKLATAEGALPLKDWKGKGFSDSSTKRWDILKAVSDGGDGGYKLLLRGQGSKEGLVKVLEANASGVINGSSKWQSIDKALKSGLESVFGDEIRKDGFIGHDPRRDANGDGFLDRAKGKAYKLFTDSGSVPLLSKAGKALSSASSKRWDAIQAADVEDGFQVLLQKGGRSKSAFQLLDVDSDGVITAKTSWLPAFEALLAGWDSRFREAILAKDSSGGGITAASVEGDAPVGQLIYTASAEDASDVTFTLESLSELPLAGLSIDAASGEVRLDPAALVPLPDSIGFAVVATDLAGNSNRLDVQVSLSQTIVDLGEASAESEAGVSALSVEDSLEDDGISLGDVGVEDPAESDSEQGAVSDGSTSDDADDANGDDSGTDGSDTEDDVVPVSDEIPVDDPEIPVLDPLTPVGDDSVPTLNVSVDSGSDGFTNDNTPVFSGVAMAASTVEVLAGDVVLGSAVADESGAWSFALSDNEALAEGTFLFTARELKPDGEDPSSSEASSLTIDQTVPEFTSGQAADVTIELTSAQVDADGDGLLDGSNGSKIVDQDKIIQIKWNKKGQNFGGSSDKPKWGYDVIRAVPNPDPEQEGAYRLLLKGTGTSNRGLFGEWSTDSDGRFLASNESAYEVWISEKQALTQGWEEVYGDVINIDGEITEGVKEDFSNISGTYFVAKDGDNTNPGTIEEPFGTIQYAIARLNPGDTINIREGTYREHLRFNHLDGTADQRITIQSYNDEEVVVSGAKEIASEWVPHEGNIWKTNVDFDVTQLFLGDSMLTGARWPNISKDWHELDDSDGSNPTPGSYWDLKTRANTNLNQSEHKLSDLGFSVEGAVAVGYKNNAVDVIQHNAGDPSFQVKGTLTGPGQPSVYYLTQHLDLLDQPKEWHYEEATGELFVWLDGNANPNEQRIEARGYGEEETSKLARTNTPSKNVGSDGDLSAWGTPDKILQMQRSSFIDFNDITFRVGAFDLWGDHDITFKNTKFLYSAHPRFMLNAEKRTIIADPYRNPFGNSAGGGGRVKGEDRNIDPSTGFGYHNSNMKWINNEFAYNFGADLDLGANSAHFLVENSHFHNNPSNGGFASFRVYDGMVARRNSVHSMGFGGMTRLGAKFGQQGGKSLAELNRIYDYHYHGDDSGIQINRGAAIGTTLQHNWIHDMPGRNGIRFDGDPAGIGGTAHHNVSFNNRRGYRFKGDQHTLVSNLAFDNEKYDFGFDKDKFYGYTGGYDPATQGLILPETGVNVYDYRQEGRRGSNPYQGNLYSIVHNNAGNIERHPIPVLNPENKTGNSTTEWMRGHSIKDELRDTANFDFRPRAGSSLIDKGTYKPGITDGFFGDAPDIGPYEYGDDYYWIPGHKTEDAKSPIPGDGAASAKPNTDLIWLEGLEMISNKVYFGSDPANLEFQAAQVSNIFTPQQSLVPGQTYYWRVDTVTDEGEVPGDVWSFTVGPANGPTDLALSTTELSSASGKGDVLATFTTTDSDPVDVHTYALVEGAGDTNNSQFSIQDGQLLFSGSEDLSADQSFQIRVSSKDSAGNSFEKELVLSTEKSQPESDTDPVIDPVADPVTDPVIDSIEIVGDGSYGKNNADRIPNFDPASQRLEIDAQSFGVDSDAFVAIYKRKKMKAAAQLDAEFVYRQRFGQLFFNPDKASKGWGSGGLVAVLEGNPVLTSEIVDVTHKPTEEPVTELVTEPVEETVTEPVTEPTEEPVTEPVTEPVEETVTEPVTEPVEEPVTEQIVDTVKVRGSGSFGRKNADIITNFDPSSQRLEIDVQSFGAESGANFVISRAKKWKKTARRDADFVYHQRSGRLYFNANGSDKNWGAGGLFAVLEGNPVLTSEIVDIT